QVKKRILLGGALLQGENRKYYNKALEGRKFICNEMNELFQKYEIVLSPTATGTAFKFGEKQSPTAMYLSDIYTVSANIAGIPAISVPRAKGEDGMPIGIQLMAGRGKEDILLKTAYKL
ncbi:MAG: amidase family protein, partial [Peptostreptococcaceae bacterium]|nr:amidase family protein [Peptostreptococcaceae bacterium]